MDTFTTLAGIAFDPHIRGILVVGIGVLILCGAVYLLLATNVGARLGFLLAVGGLAGWMVIQGLTWWFLTPAIGPRGDGPTWVATDIAWGQPDASAEPVLEDLPNVCWSSLSRDCQPVDGVGTVSAEVLAANPAFVEEVGPDGTLSELVVLDPTIEDDLELGAWSVLPASDFGDALAIADEQLRDLGVFESTADYIVLDGFRQGGKEPLPADPSRLDRIWHTITSATQLTHPTHYAVVQVIPVVPQEVVVGEAPPTPIPNTEMPVASVLMVRDLGNERVPAALMTLGSLVLLGVTCYALHRRDQLATAHMADAA